MKAVMYEAFSKRPKLVRPPEPHSGIREPASSRSVAAPMAMARFQGAGAAVFTKF